MTRAAMDWDEAFTYYASLPDGRRTYREVAERFGVSDRTVERTVGMVAGAHAFSDRSATPPERLTKS